MRPPARAVVGNLVWSTDGGVWALWRIAPFARGYLTPADRQPVQSRLRGLLDAVPADTTVLSVCERIDPLDIAVEMADGVDLVEQEAWADACELTADWLTRAPVYRRRHYLASRLPGIRRAWRDILRDAAADVGALFGVGPTPIAPAEIDLRQAQADQIEAQLAPHVRCQAVTAGEVCWLYARTLRRDADDPPFDEAWEPPDEPHGVWARLTDAVVKEGGDEDDAPKAPRQRRFVRIESPGGTAYQTVFALTDMPHSVSGPAAPGDWLALADDVGFPVDWCLRVRAAGGGTAGKPGRPDANGSAALVQAHGGGHSPDDPRVRLAAGSGDADQPGEPEREVTVLLSVAAPDLTELEERAEALTELFEPHQYGLARPTRDQAELWRSMLPATDPTPACHPYVQFMSVAEVAAGTPFCNPDVGDSQGLLLGVSLDGGTGTPVLLDPTLRFRASASPSLAAVGDAGSGKSFLLKRLTWDTIARGGQVVAVDVTPDGEYARFAADVPGRAQVLALEPGTELSLDPLRSEEPDEDRLGITLGFLSLLVGCAPGSDEAVTLARALEVVADRPGGGLQDVVDELARRGSGSGGAGAARASAAAGLARRLARHRHASAGQVAFGPGRPPSAVADLDADLVVLRVPDLVLPSGPAWHPAVPEQVLGQALLYLVVALAQQVARRNPGRFTATLCDGAGPLLASPHGQRLLGNAARDGRMHNGALWLASDHPDDFASEEVDGLLGSRFAFHQPPDHVPAALRFLGLQGSDEAAATLEAGFAAGQCLFRDVHHRAGLVHVLPPLQPDIDRAFEKVPGGGGEPPALAPGQGPLVLQPDQIASLPIIETVEVLHMPPGNTPLPIDVPAGDQDGFDGPDGSATSDGLPEPLDGHDRDDRDDRPSRRGGPEHDAPRGRRSTPLARALQDRSTP